MGATASASLPDAPGSVSARCEPAHSVSTRNAVVAPGYDLLIRAFGSGWFLLLGIFVARAAWVAERAPGGHAWADMLSRAALVVFYATLWLLMLIRPPQIAASPGLLPRIAALVGTYLPWAVALLPEARLSAGGHLAASGLVLFGNVMVIAVIWQLGRSFSLVPQARSLVTSGPYAVIRHPLYLAEAVMLSGATILHLSPAAVALLLFHSAVQLRRILYEEALLMRTFPQYRGYAARTRRLIPGVW